MAEAQEKQQAGDSTWTERQILLQQWLALPKRQRKPKTLEQLAVALSVDPATMWRWRKLPGFSEDVRKLIREQLADDLPEIYAALRREAKIGNYQHIKLALELVGDYVQKIAPTTPDGNEQYKDVGDTEQRILGKLAGLFTGNGTQESVEGDSAN